MLTDGAHYTLPDGTLVEATRTSSGEWRLNDSDGTPLFYTAKGVLHRLEYHPPPENRYRLVPCDLTVGDLTLVE